MVVLEGPSDTALWQVGRALRDWHGYSLRVHRPGPLGAQEILARIADGHRRICLLRSHLSDVVDGRLTGQHAGGERETLRALELALLALATRVIQVIPEALTETQLPLAWTAAGIPRVERLYGEGAEQLPWQTRLPVTRWREREIGARGRLTTRFQRWLRPQIRREAAAARFLPPSLGIGSLSPAFLVIGEGPTGSPCRHTGSGDLPDLPFSRGPASELLWRAVDEIGLRWWEGYWLNAATRLADTGWSRENVPMPRTGRILCLGEAAEALVIAWFGEEYAAELAAAGRWRVVAHPSHVMRFKNRDYPRYRDEIGAFLAPHSDSVGDVLDRNPGTVLDLEP